jgi:nitroimidazol reductase NimA-like FMN-containing flavoprotein (pyridoxamine 5'-phosphate oxidase superfamily)
MTIALESGECRELLGGSGVGRVALTYKALPIIVRVRYAPAGDDLVLRADDEVLLRAAQEGQIVCLETGADDSDNATGWSVAVIGRLSLVFDRDGAAAARLVPQITRGTRQEGARAR